MSAPLPTEDELRGLSRKQLQALAKTFGIKANQKTGVIIDVLVAKGRERAPPTCAAEDSTPESPAMEPGAVEPQESNILASKEHESTLCEETTAAVIVEAETPDTVDAPIADTPRETVELLVKKLSEEPKQHKSKVPVRKADSQTASKGKARKPIDWDKIHSKGFSKMKSINEYGSAKKGKRSSPRLAQVQKAKSILQASGLATTISALPRASVTAKKTVARKAAKVTASSPKSPRVLNKTAAAKAYAATVRIMASSSKGKAASKSNVKASASPALTKANAVRALAAKQIASLSNSPLAKKIVKRVPISQAVKVHKSMLKPAAETPRTPAASDKSAKTTNKFDLAASLSRPLSYQPHKGKLKPLSMELPAVETPSKAGHAQTEAALKNANAKSTAHVLKPGNSMTKPTLKRVTKTASPRKRSKVAPKASPSRPSSRRSSRRTVAT